MTKVEPSPIGGRAVEDWDRLWVTVDDGLKDYQPSLRNRVGLYRVSRNGVTMAIGTGTDKAGGLAKRLSDFHRPSPSGRNHHAGLLIYGARDSLKVEVLVTGSDGYAREIGRQLKMPMTRLHEPAWNLPDAPFMRKG